MRAIVLWTVNDSTHADITLFKQDQQTGIFKENFPRSSRERSVLGKSQGCQNSTPTRGKIY